MKVTSKSPAIYIQLDELEKRLALELTLMLKEWIFES